jgi:hypothetical protein
VFLVKQIVFMVTITKSVARVLLPASHLAAHPESIGADLSGENPSGANPIQSEFKLLLAEKRIVVARGGALHSSELNLEGLRKGEVYGKREVAPHGEVSGSPDLFGPTPGTPP